MERIYRKIFKFERFIGENLELSIIYLLSAIITYLAYKQDVITISFGTELIFETKSISGAAMIIFAMIYTLLIKLLPTIIAVVFYMQYNKEFSNSVKITNIIPISNKEKMKRYMITAFIGYIAYFMITSLLALLVPEGGEMIYLIEDLLFKIAMNTSIVLSVIVVDMCLRRSHISGTLRGLLNLMTMICWLILFVMLAVVINGIRILIGVIFITIILQLIYIFRNIESIKID